MLSFFVPSPSMTVQHWSRHDLFTVSANSELNSLRCVRTAPMRQNGSRGIALPSKKIHLYSSVEYRRRNLVMHINRLFVKKLQLHLIWKLVTVSNESCTKYTFYSRNNFRILCCQRILFFQQDVYNNNILKANFSI